MDVWLITAFTPKNGSKAFLHGLPFDNANWVLFFGMIGENKHFSFASTIRRLASVAENACGM